MGWERTNDMAQYVDGQPLFDQLLKWRDSEALCVLQNGTAFAFCHMDDVREVEDALSSSDFRQVAKDALMEFIGTIEATGGLDGEGNPVGDPEWVDLGTAYVQACVALGREPMTEEECT